MAEKTERFDGAVANFDIGLESWEGMIEASKELLQAELAMPLVPSDQIAWLSYLDRTRTLYRKAHGTLGIFDGPGAARHRRICRDLVAECRAIEDRLGLPHADANYNVSGHEDEVQPDDLMADDFALPEGEGEAIEESLISK